MEWSKEEQIEKMTEVASSLFNNLRKRGIEFSPTDGDLPNVVLKYKEKVLKISHHVFYRFSGISTIRILVGDHEFTWQEVTDSMFMNSYMLSIIFYNFFGEKKKK